MPLTGPPAMADDFQLTEHDKATSLWLRLRQHFNERLAILRVRNDAALSEVDTATLRGEIRLLKHLMTLDTARPSFDD